MKFLSVSDRVLLTFWVGALWSIGYIAVPTLFASLDDKRMAGEVAGQMFHIVNYLGLFCGTLLLINLLVRKIKSWQLWVIVAMLILVGCNEFVIQPIMQDLKASGLLEGSAEQKQFGQMHGLASVLYMLTSLFGLALTMMQRPGFNSEIH